jgi:hypothetical protein
MKIAVLDFEDRVGSGDKKAFHIAQSMKPVEVDAASVHDVKSAGLGS